MKKTLDSAFEKARERSGLESPVIGLESEFSLYVNGSAMKPEDEFKDPKAFLSQDAMHRVGTSYSVSTGGAWGRASAASSRHAAEEPVDESAHWG